jgi:LytS/YehU family sensor histidine kinase
VRFGERLNVNVDCSTEACTALVPSFLVQPLVENAVKHGVARSSAPVAIEIDAAIDEGCLCIKVANCVADTESEPLRDNAGAGVGLANVERRLQAVFGKRASLEAVRENGRFVATICIPEIQQAN